MATAVRRDSKSLPKFPTGPVGFKLFEEIGSGAFAKVYRGVVCAIGWDAFVKAATENGVSEKCVKILEEKGYKTQPRKLLELTRGSGFTEVYGGAENMSDMDKEEGECVALDILECVKAARVETKENVAVKIIEAEHANWDDIRQELATMRSMNHENVVRVNSAFVNELEKDQELWIVMPLLAVGSCSSVLRDFYPNGIKDPKVLATILHKVLKALAYFHKDGRIHRDVKAGNILLSAEGEVKLADFGVSANTIEHGSRDNLRKTFVGTPCWMAPEVMEQRNGYNTKADIWSFGITAMELAYGYAPYAHEAAMKVLVLTLKNPPPTCEQYKDYGKPAFPKSFHKMIAKCLDKNPAQRPDANKMASHSFFKLKADSKYLVENLIKKVLEEREKENHEPKKFWSEDRQSQDAGGTGPPAKSFEVETFEFKGKDLDNIREEVQKMKKQKENGGADGEVGEGEKRGRFTVVKGEAANEKKRGRFTIKESQEIKDTQEDKSEADGVQRKGRFIVKATQEPTETPAHSTDEPAQSS